MTTSPPPFRWFRIDDREPVNHEGWDFRILTDPGMLPGVGVQFVSFPVGARITAHRHHHTEALVVTLRGRCRAVVNGVERMLAPGDVLYVGKGTWHSYETVGDEPWDNLVVHAPQAYTENAALDIEHWSGIGQ